MTGVQTCALPICFPVTIILQIHKRYEYLLRMTFEPIEKKGVWFVGVRSVRPHEMYNVIAKNTQQKTFETNKESLYPVKLVFKYGMDKNTAREMDPVYVLLPFCDRYGDVWIRGSQYSLQIVLFFARRRSGLFYVLNSASFRCDNAAYSCCG